MSNEQIFGIVFATLVVFVVIREVICWYFKINERTKLLTDIKSELVKLNKLPVDI